MSIFNIGARADRRNRTQSQAGAGNRRNNTVANNGMPSTIGDMGSMLRARREAMGATLAEAEVATRIRQKFLAALEADEWALLPGEVVGRGFLRNYAAYLGLEPTEILDPPCLVPAQGLCCPVCARWTIAPKIWNYGMILILSPAAKFG